jgi:SPW repeat
MAIRQATQGAPGSAQHLGVDVGASPGTGALWRNEEELGVRQDLSPESYGDGMKVLKPLPHAVLDYATAGMLMASPWLFGFRRNRTACANAFLSGAAVLGLSLMTRYPLGVFKLIPFKTHGVVETIAALATAAAPWTLGFARDESAKWTHVAAGLGTLAVVAVTDYQAADNGSSQ